MCQFLLLLAEGVKGGVVQSHPSSNADDTACPASLRFKERSRPDATIIPACRARHGHHRALYTSTDSQLTIGKCNSERRTSYYLYV